MIRVDETDPVGEIEPSFPYRDVTVRRGVEFKDYYEIESEIGRGKFGTVYRCKEKNTGLALAAKVVNTARKEDRRSVDREVEIMRRLQHPRLIQLYDAIDTGKHIHVILELIEGGELFERVIGDDFVLTERSCAVFMRQICEGIEFVHTQNILHLDMKPENILCLTKEGNRIKIIDFGLARKYDPEKKLQVLFGTPEFVAPEVVNFEQIGYGTDMWSIGVICYVLLSGLSPFMGDTDIETMANVTIAKYDFDDEAFAEISEDAKDFIRGLLVKDIQGRLSASRCRQHAWLARKSPALPKVTAKPQVERPSAELNAGTVEELDMTKDNLRLFVERWREHPDSPYLIELDAPPRWDSKASVNPEPPHTYVVNEIDHESISLRGQSPSPCGSICSAVSSESRSSSRANNPFQLSVPGSGIGPGLGFPFERRASEGTGLGTGREKPRDPAAQIVLAEEIIKLSEHLRSIALAPRPALVDGSSTTASPSEIPSSTDNQAGLGAGKTDVQSVPVTGKKKSLYIASNGLKDTRDDEGSSQRGVGDVQMNGGLLKKSDSNRNIRKTTGNRGDNAKHGVDASLKSNGRIPATAGSSSTNEIEKKLSTLVEQRKQKGTTFNGVSNYERRTETSSAFEVSSFGSKRTSKPQVEPRSKDGVKKDSLFRLERTNSSQQSGAEDFSSARNSNSSKASTFLKKSTTQTGSFSEADDPAMMFTDKHVDLTPPWRRGRGKSKHRFSETCRDVPRISNLQDLHQNLNLDEPTSTKDLLLHLLGGWDDVTRPNGIGRKSISVDWCGEESIGRRSMSSLAEYFQSEREKPASGVPPTTQPSIHR